MRYKKNNLKVILGSLLCISIMFISIGYSALNTNLTISGTALVTPINNNIYIEDIVLNSFPSTSASEKSPSLFEDTTSTFYPYLSNASATINYSVTIVNNTNINQVYSGFNESYSNKNLTFRIDGLSVGKILLPGERITFVVTIANFVNYSSTGSLSIEYLFNTQQDIPTVKQYLTGVTSTTNSYVRTGFYPSSNSKVIVDYTLTTNKSSSMWLFSSRRAYQNQMFAIAWNSTESLLQFHTTSYNLGAQGFVPNVRYSAQIDKNGLILNGRNYYNPSDTVWSSVYELYLFANNEGRWIRGILMELLLFTQLNYMKTMNY